MVATIADSNGDAREAGFLSEGQHSLQLHVTDTLGKSVTESVVLQVGGANNPPSCAITSPADQSGSPVGDPVIFRGTATDPDVGSNELTISWISDKDGALGAGSIDSAGELSFPYAGLSADTHTITLEVLDEVGEYCSDTIILSIGSAPEISLYAPLTGDLYQLSESISFDALVTDSDEISSQLSIAWESDLDGVFSQQPSDSNGILSFNKSTLSAGQS